MQYSSKELEFLGKQVVAGRYVSRSLMVSTLALTLVLGIGIGRYLLPAESSGQETTVKRPLSEGGVADMGKNKERLQHIFKHEEEVRGDPGNVEAWKALGNLYFDAGEAAKSVNAYNRALELQPGDPDVLVDCGVMYRELRQYDKALEYFNKALAVNPRHEHALFNSGIVLYFDLDRKDEALTAWRSLERINPEAKAPNGAKLADMIEKLK
ncbi:MAG: tetratricopeptide repeat protein [Desulfovibrio sp.]|nr:tetratricopeptide repeat protein [Desulfovibrio sp.]